MASAALASGEDLSTKKKGKRAASQGGAMTLSKGFATLKTNSGLLILGLAGFTAANRYAAKEKPAWKEIKIPFWEKYVDTRAVIGVGALALCHFAPKQVGKHGKTLWTLGAASLLSYGLDMIADQISAPKTEGVGATEVGRKAAKGGYDQDLAKLRALRARQLEADADYVDAESLPVGAYAE